MVRGIGKPTAASLVMNWNSDKMAASLEHFQRLGHRQIIAGYYDQPPEQINTWLNTVTERNLIVFMA